MTQQSLHSDIEGVVDVQVQACRRVGDSFHRGGISFGLKGGGGGGGGLGSGRL